MVEKGAAKNFVLKTLEQTLFLYEDFIPSFPRTSDLFSLFFLKTLFLHFLGPLIYTHVAPSILPAHILGAR